MNTEIKNAVNAADTDAGYDDRAKRLLGNKIILAQILTKTIDEFYGMEPKEIIPLIENCCISVPQGQNGLQTKPGQPLIGAVPIEPGLTNEQKKVYGQRITGLNTENVEINEGLIRFDIVFYVRMKDSISQIIINVEVQKDIPAEYDILNRAVFYVSRLISSQKERDFTGTNYNDIKRVFSIWICMNMNENSMNFVHLTNDKLLGSCQWGGKMDLFNIVLIGIAKELPVHDEQYKLHRLLNTLLSAKISVDRKLEIIEKEYDIPIDDEMREDVSVMCNLSQGILEEGEHRGEAAMITKMYKKGYTLKQIADVAEKSIEEVKAIIGNFEPVPSNF